MENERMSYPPRLREGEQIRAADWNVLVETVRAATSVSTITPEEVASIADANQPLAIIIGKAQTATSEPWSYDWVRAALQPDGTVMADHDLAGNTGNSSVGYYMARERGGNAFVPVDGSAVVKLKLSDAGTFFEFSYDPTDNWLELTGGAGPAYAWTRKIHLGGASFGNLINPYTGSTITGTTSQNPAREYHGVTALPAGTIVRAWRGYSSGAPQVVIRRAVLGDGVAVHEQHSLYIKGATAGTYTLTFEGVGPTSALAWNHNAAALETALEALANLTAVTVTGSGTEATPYLIEYLDDFAEHHPSALVADIGGLKGDQEWLFDCLYGGNVTFNNITILGSIISTLMQGVKLARVTVTSLGAGYTRTGNVIEATANGTLGTQDGLTMTTFQRLFLRSGNSDAGLYVIDSVGSAGTKFSMTRTADADESAEMVSGTLVYVYDGTPGTGFKGTLWRLYNVPPVVLNTDALDFRLLAPQGVRLLAQEIYGRGSIRYVAGSNVTIGIVDDAANDEVEVTISATGTANTVDTIGDHYQEADAANPAYSGIVTIIADKGSGLDFLVSGTNATLKMLDANYAAGSYYPGKVTTGQQFWHGDKAVGTDDANKGTGETWVNGGFLSLRADGPRATVASGLTICSGYNAAPTLNTDPDLDLSAGTSQRTFWNDIRVSSHCAGMSLWNGTIGTYGRATSLLMEDAGTFILETWGYSLSPPQIYLRWGDPSSPPASWNLVYGKTTSFMGGTFTAGLFTGLSTGFSSGTIPISNGSGDFAPDTGLKFDAALDALTLGGYLVTKATSAPSGIPTNSIAGPFLTD